ncbi:MAG: S24 family peptidase [Methylobacter sp.]|uniref:S24 family peptidase n=1 Tax=Methylobacter sp. TaxID=2051955 RepID=UPI002731D0FF|nr:S24 family peptidase [Methylobacter sp.]MDP1664090.1 S24 family peptidase [Methylobacter sp.]
MHVQKPQGDLRTSSGSASLRDPSPQSAALSLSDQAHSDETEAVWDDFALVPVYDVQASAGHGSHVEAELQTGQLAFKKAWLREKGLKIGHLAIITAKGDSMDPTICDRDTLLVDTRVDKIIDDSIYIVQADHHLIVKRLQQAFDGSVSIISDNPRYKEQTLTPEQAKTLKIAGRVCWYGHEI